MDQTIAKELFEETTYPWEVLALIGDFILKTGPELPEEEINRIGDPRLDRKICCDRKNCGD